METDNGAGWAKGKRIERALPEEVRVLLGRAVVMCRKMPRVQGHGRGGEEKVFVSDGVLILEAGCTFEGRELAGVYKLFDRWISGRHVRVLPYKARGSQDHHKFVVAVTDGVVS